MADNDSYKVLSDDEVDSVVGGASAGRKMTEVKPAYCRLCGFRVYMTGRARVEGCSTGVFECTNPSCDNYGKTLYNTGVKFETK